MMMKLDEVLYVNDILAQVSALRGALNQFEPKAIKPIANLIKKGAFDRILLTGMGASFYALYPTYLYLSRLPIAVIWVETAELIHYTNQQITPKTLIWIVSQSGRSAEIITIIEHLKKTPPGYVIATTNDLSSPLAEYVNENPAQSLCLPIHAAPESTVSTRTYLNSLALCQLTARLMLKEDLSQAFQELEDGMRYMQTYLDHWQQHLDVIAKQIRFPKHLLILGRGSSIASAYCGAMIMGEVGGNPAISMSAGQFRHGPLEMCAPDLTVLLFAGAPQTRHFNQRLAKDIAAANTQIFWLGGENAEIPNLPMPEVQGAALPLGEMLPMQLLSIHLAVQAGKVPGDFQHIGKVTLLE
jgi:glutamine---fructose-6-phosphate transaminase (isomerizing)